ncbi:MAG: hypothetical protein PWP24_2004 [Clostridiales bacterium]|nr:hypothetical protein [Clostridiales bacterium]
MDRKEKWIFPDHEGLTYSGRIEDTNKKEPIFVYPSTMVEFSFTGTCISVVLENRSAYWDNYMGYLLDGVMYAIKLLKNQKQTYCLASEMEDTTHTLILFKRMDSCHVVTLYGFLLDAHAIVIAPEEKPSRRIEVYGDSVSAGEVSEAVAYEGKPDPEHNGEYSNSWYSYSWILARKLHATLHNISQGGIALMDGTGWFHGPSYLGLLSCYDKITYHPELGSVTNWDFTRYRPHVVIIAIGQNDNHPVDFMKEDYEGAKAKEWRSKYADFVKTLRTHYPQAWIILATTILEHDTSWDQAIEEVCGCLKDEKVVHFLYTQNGTGTPGHIRIGEAEKMAEELQNFIESLGDTVWMDEMH